MRPTTIVPPTEQFGADCACGNGGIERRDDQARGNDRESHLSRRVADQRQPGIRQNRDSRYFGSNFSATPFMQ